MRKLTKLQIEGIKKRIAYLDGVVYNNPTRLLTVLNIPRARNRGFVCPNCESGTGPKGTGMEAYSPCRGKLRFKCFACGAHYSPIDLVHKRYPLTNCMAIIDYLERLYAPEDDPVNDRELPVAGYTRGWTFTHASEFAPDDRLLKTYERSIAYREACPEWQQKVADMFGLPFEALNRPDIGKSFLGDDGEDPNCGDLVTYNLFAGGVITLKVRHTPGIGYKNQLTRLDYKTNTFVGAPARDSERTFRQAGESGGLCFGLSTITPETPIVVVTEGQSDALAVCSAAQECDATCITAIGRDSANHQLKIIDLEELKDKHVYYCQDADDAGSRLTSDNLSLIKLHAASTHLWTPNILGCKDPRATYLKIGASALISNLLNTSTIYA